jgi:hypothetical protein
VKLLCADSNDFDDNGSLPLTCAASARSISEFGEPLEDGQEVMLSDGECWVVARVHRREDRTWDARGEWRFESHGEHGEQDG